MDSKDLDPRIPDPVSPVQGQNRGRFARRLAIALLSLWVSFVLLTVTTEQLYNPPWLQAMIVPLYRIFYLVYMPVRQIFQGFEPAQTSYISIVPPIAASTILATSLITLWLLNRRTQRRTKGQAAHPNDMSRRQMLERSVKSTVFVCGAGAAVYGSMYQPGRLAVRRYTIPIADLPPSLEGLRIAHISDTHYGPFIPLPFIRHAIDTANALQPDFVVLTGDYVHRTPKAIPDGIAILRHIEARLGVAAVLGNHDHWEGADLCRQRFADIGIPLIDNARVFLHAKGLVTDADENALCLGGVGDYWEDAVLPARAFENIPASMPRLLLSHNPDVSEHFVENLRVDLMLSGHTHGGQVWLPGLGTPIVPSEFGSKYAGGLCDAPSCPVLVSRGVGMAVLPVRVAVPPEISEITLIRL